MTTTLPPTHIEGMALWAPTLPDWAAASAAFRGEAAGVATPLKRPAPELLHAAERRRAPDTVVLALEVAAQAVAQSGRSAQELHSVFTSAHGDLSLTDHMCRILATTPTLLSPTKFHHSVHNAPSGYWTLSTHCMQASTAVSAFECSFAAGLLEALTHCAADHRPVLLVGYDVAASGALATTNQSRGLLGVALVLAPQASQNTLFTLQSALVTSNLTNLTNLKVRTPLQSSAAQALATNAMADALPLFEALARGDEALVQLPLSNALGLELRGFEHRTKGDSP
jgi:Beta-ketoacyl synthase, N-terminal domain